MRILYSALSIGVVLFFLGLTIPQYDTSFVSVSHLDAVNGSIDEETIEPYIPSSSIPESYVLEYFGQDIIQKLTDLRRTQKDAQRAVGISIASEKHIQSVVSIKEVTQEIEIPCVKKPTEKLNDDIIKYAKTYLGVRYRFGGESRRSGLDCSSFTQKVLRKNGISIPRTAYQQAHAGRRVKKRHLQKGDLIFFRNTDRRHTISHVGIYLGNGRFIHASSAAHRVTITKFRGFYVRHFAGARRFT